MTYEPWDPVCRVHSLLGSEEGGLTLLLGRFNSMKKQKIYTYVLLIKHEKVLLNFGDTI